MKIYNFQYICIILIVKRTIFGLPNYLTLGVVDASSNLHSETRKRHKIQKNHFNITKKTKCNRKRSYIFCKNVNVPCRKANVL